MICYNKEMSNTISSKITPVRLFIISLIILLLAATWGWYRLDYANPDHVFNRMLANTLATSGVSKQVSQSESEQKMDQSTQLVAAPEHRARSIAALQQGVDGSTVVTTESIGTTTADFVRYNNIKTGQKTADGKSFNFSSVLGIWGKSDASNPNSNGGAQLYNQTVLGVFPVGNVNPNQRRQLLAQINKDQVYTIDNHVKKGSQSGRPLYTYSVTVKPVAYVSMLKTFARDLGLQQLEAVDPSQYADSSPIKFTIDVDVWSGELIKINYSDSARSEAFSAYGVRRHIDLPDKTIPVDELQTRLQQLH